MFNPSMFFEAKNAWDSFVRNHPKFPLFLKAASSKAIKEGTIIEISLTTAEGEVINTNLRLSASDMEAIEVLKNMTNNMR